MITAEEIAWAAISEVRGIGPKTLWGLADYLESQHKSATWLIDNPDNLRDSLGSRCSETDILLAINRARNKMLNLDENCISVLHPLHPLFPPRLRLLRHEFSLPAVLYVRGSINLLSGQSIAVVGARNAGDLAMTVTKRLVEEMTRNGINVISGYAKGIDSAAHIAALQGCGTTTIVLPEGINNFSVKRDINPFSNWDNTLVVSQFEPNARWSPYFAMNRNKLVCAMSSAVLIIVSGPERDHEGRMSGTFDAGITALKMGIPVFVVTPSCFDDQPKGNQALIRHGCFELEPSQGIAPLVRAITPVSQGPALISDKSKNATQKSKKTEPRYR